MGALVGLSAIALAGLAPCAGAQPAAEVEKGRAMAQRLCAVCHLNEGQGEKHGPMGIPGFRAVANRPAQTIEQIVRWLRSVPAVMPDHNLTTDESYALAEYIMSLREGQ